MCLVYGFAEELKQISVETVMEVIRDKRIMRQQAAAAGPQPERERLRAMVKEIKGVDIAVVEARGA